MDPVSEELAALLREEIRAENRRIRLFRFLTDLTRQRLFLEILTVEEARDLVDGLRLTALCLFPGKGHVFDLVIAPRLERVIGERFGAGGRGAGSPDR